LSGKGTKRIMAWRGPGKVLGVGQQKALKANTMHKGKLELRGRDRGLRLGHLSKTASRRAKNKAAC